MKSVILRTGTGYAQINIGSEKTLLYSGNITTYMIIWSLRTYVESFMLRPMGSKALIKWIEYKIE